MLDNIMILIKVKHISSSPTIVKSAQV